MVEGGEGVCRVKIHSQDDQGSIRFMQQATRRKNELTIAPHTEDAQGYLTIASPRFSAYLISSRDKR